METAAAALTPPSSAEVTRRTTDHGDGGGGTDPPSSAEVTRRRTDHGDGGGGTDPPLFWRQRDELTSAFTLDLSECSDITSNGDINPRLGLLKYNSKSTSSEGSRVPN